MSLQTSIGSNNIAHKNGESDIVKYTASTAGTYGVLTFSTATAQSSGVRLTGIADPTQNSDVATKRYVDDQAINGVQWKSSVKAASTDSVTIADLDADSTLDGISLNVDDRVLLKDQSQSSENGLYKINASGNAATRVDDLAQGTDITSVAVFVEQGSVNADMGFVVTSDSGTVGSSALTWTQFTALGQVVAGNGLSQTDDKTMNIDLHTLPGLEHDGGKLRVKASTGLSIGGDGGLAVNANLSHVNQVGTVTSGEWQSNVTVGTGKAIDVSLGTLTTSNTQKLAILQGANSDVDIGNFDLRASTLTADSLTADKLLFTGTDGVLSTDAALSCDGNTLTIGNGKTLDVSGGTLTLTDGQIAVAKTALEASHGLAISGNSIALDLHATAPSLEFHEQKLRLKVKPSSGIESTATGVGIAANGIATSMLANDAVNASKLHPDCAGNGLQQHTSGALEVKVDNVGLEINADTVRVKDNGIRTSKIDDGAVTNAKLAGSIAYNKLNLTGELRSSDFADNAISGDKINGGTIDSITITSVDIDGGTIDGTTIGATTPAAGTFTQVNCTSDARLKEDIRTIDPEEALRVIRESRGVTFRFKKECGGGLSAGVIAQEAENVLPRAVRKQACSQTKLADRRAVDYQAYTGYLLAACKTLAERVEALEASSKKRKRARDKEDKEGGEQKRR